MTFKTSFVMFFSRMLPKSEASLAEGLLQAGLGKQATKGSWGYCCGPLVPPLLTRAPFWLTASSYHGAAWRGNLPD